MARMHGGAADAQAGTVRCAVGQGVQDDTPGLVSAMPSGSGEPTVHPAPPAELAVGDRFHLCLDLARPRARGLRDRCLSQLYRGLRVSHSMQTDFVLDVREQALYARQPDKNTLIHHSNRGSQYVSIRYTERLTESSIEQSVGSRGDNYDNALAETINGLYQAEIIHRRGPWKSVRAVPA